MITFETSILPEYTLIEIKFEGNLSPDALKSLNPPSVDGTKGVVLSGRAPVWLYGFLVHNYHPTAWVATADPRIGYVVVASHSQDKSVGDVIDPNAPIII